MRERILKYKNTGNCPACNHKMTYEGQVGACAPRFVCVCGYSVFNFTGMAAVNPDLLPIDKR